MIDPELKIKWLAALKEYPKTKARLKTSEGFCCLGVLVDICEGSKVWERGPYCFSVRVSGLYCSTSVPKKYKNLEPDEISALMGLNDNNQTFEPVIEFIEKNL